MTDKKDKTLNTIVTDGKGGIKVQIGSLDKKYAHPIVIAGIEVHEGVHVEQALASIDQALLKNQPEGLILSWHKPDNFDAAFSLEKLFELPAYRAEVKYLVGELQNVGRNSAAGKAILHRINGKGQINDYVNRYGVKWNVK